MILFYWLYLTLDQVRKSNKMKGKVQIKVKGQLDKQWEEIFHGMSFSYEKDSTVLTGHIMDEAQLHGILNTIRDFNLKLISVNPMELKQQS